MTVKELLNQEINNNQFLGLPIVTYCIIDASEQIKNYIEELTGEKVIVKKVSKTKYAIQPVNDIERFNIEITR